MTSETSFGHADDQVRSGWRRSSRKDLSSDFLHYKQVPSGIRTNCESLRVRRSMPACRVCMIRGGGRNREYGLCVYIYVYACGKAVKGRVAGGSSCVGLG